MAKKVKQPGLYFIEVDRSGLPEEPYNFHQDFEDRPSEIEIIAILEEEDIGYQPDYCKIEITLIRPLEENKDMAKQQKPKTKEVIEDAQVISESVNEVKATEIEVAEVIEEKKEEFKFDIAFPETPAVFNVQYKEGEIKEHSLAEVKKLETELNELLVKADEKSYENKELWEKIDRVRINAKDQRTKLSAHFKTAMKPVNEFIDKVKGKVKGIEDGAKTVETKAEEAIKKRANWEAEQIRLAEEAKLKLVETRKESLRDLGGKFNIEAGIFTFSYDASIVINNDDMYDLSEEDFEKEMEYVRKSYKEEQDRIEKEKKDAIKAQEDADKAKLEAEKKKEELLELRSMILLSGGYEKDDAGYHKNGYTITEEVLIEMSNAEMIALTKTHDIPVPSEEPEPVVEEMEAVPTPDDVTLPEPEPISKEEEEDMTPAPDISPAPSKQVMPDPLENVVSGMVNEHNEHQDKVDQVVRLELVFSKDNPYITINMGKSVVMITHESFEDVALANIDANLDMLAKGVTEDGLMLMAIGKKKK